VTKSYRPEILNKLNIPLYAGSLQYREYYYLEQKYTSEQVDSILNERLEQFLKSLQEKGVQIIEKDVKISNNSVSYIQSGNIKIIEPILTKQPTIRENITDSGE
jgi:similar to stage IV sporulation protein